MILFLEAAPASPAPTRWQWKAAGVHWQANITPRAYLVQQLNLLYHHQVFYFTSFFNCKRQFPKYSGFCQVIFFSPGIFYPGKFPISDCKPAFGKAVTGLLKVVKLCWFSCKCATECCQRQDIGFLCQWQEVEFHPAPVPAADF